MAALLHLQSSAAAAPSFLLLRRRGGGVAPAGSSRRRRACFRVEAKIREIFMPALSSTMTEGKIVSWTASEGDRLAKGDPVVVVESDKADMDVETFHDGFLAAVLVPAGESAPVGSAIALLAESEDEIPAAQSKAASLSSSSSSSPPPPPPQESTPPPPPPPPPAPVAAAVSAPAPPSPASQGGLRVVASPYARKLAKDLNVDLNSITGSGPGGRIVAKDVEAAAAAPKKAAPVAAARPDVPLGSTVPFTTMQGAVSKNMVESLAVPTFRVGYTFTTDALDALYKKIKPKGVTMSALLAKATAMALVQHPVINSSCRDGKSFTYNSSINIAVAVAIDGGLITPVLPDADKGAIMAVGSSQPTLVGTKGGSIGIKNQMQRSHPTLHGGAMAATAASPERARAEVDTSSAFRSVKEAVAVFGERILVGENRNGGGGYGGGDRRAGREGRTRSNTLAIAASFAKLEGGGGGGDGVRVSNHSKPNAIGVNAKLPVASDAAPPAMYLVPSSSPPFFASSPSLANDDDGVSAASASDAMVMGSIRKVEEEAARARQEVVQLKRRLAETELAMATLSAKLHRALSKLAHMEADRAAAERARIQRRDGRDMALAVWAASGGGDRRRGVATAAAHAAATARRQPLGELLRLGEADVVVGGGGGGGEMVIGGQRRAAAAARRKVQKEKPIVPLIVPLINGIIFSRKKRNKDKESLYMKELYSLLRLS
uniref:Dihydrolipoamide acetyltransferase component of pyruvate dehydrogenase complex n=1 Tax=Oryza nivara TaxID=4536 RepID=A0A0E0ILV6_ORYNI